MVVGEGKGVKQSRMNARQIAMYQCFLQSNRVKTALQTARRALPSLIVLQKMHGMGGELTDRTNHVMLLSQNERRTVNEVALKEAGVSQGVLFDGIFGDEASDLDLMEATEAMEDEEETEEEEEEETEEEEEIDGSKEDEANLSAMEYALLIQKQRQAKLEASKPDPASSTTQKEQKGLSIHKLQSLLRQLSEDALYAYGNKLSVVVPLVARLLSEGSRVIVFARYLKMLLILDECFQRKGIRTIHYNGMLGLEQRAAALSAFKQSESGVLLITVGAGGEGITVTEADRIVLVDPNWNPTVDEQAIDRA